MTNRTPRRLVFHLLLVASAASLANARAASAQCSINGLQEAVARKIVQEMQGTVIMPCEGSSNCGGGTSCGDADGCGACLTPATQQCGLDNDNRYHHGVMYDRQCGFLARGTVCVTGFLPQDGHRGSDFLHEAMHLYLMRLADKGLVSAGQIGDECLTDQLAKLQGATSGHHCFSMNPSDGARSLWATYPPANNPRWYP